MDFEERCSEFALQNVILANQQEEETNYLNHENDLLHFFLFHLSKYWALKSPGILHPHVFIKELLEVSLD